MTKKTKKKQRKRIEEDGKFYTVRGVELTRNAGWLTEAEYFAKILSALRQTTRYWKPALTKLEERKRDSQSSNKRIKYEYQCEICQEWFVRAKIDIDHVVPCGGINGYDKIVPWLLKAHIEDKDGYQILCKSCHKIKTAEERKGRQ